MVTRLGRRELLGGAAAWVALAGCDRTADAEKKPPAPAPSPSPSPSPSAPRGVRRRIVQGVDVRELFPHGAGEDAPVVVAIHGRGDHPARWIDTWMGFPRAAHVVLPCAFHPFGDGFSWFDLRPDMTDAEVAKSLGDAEAKLWPALAEIAGTRPLFVTGFSQGGMLSFAIAARHGDRVAGAFPVAGACPAPLLPAAGTKTAPVVAFHGTSDAVIPFAKGKAAVEALRARGQSAELHEYAGAGHTITEAMHDRLWSELARALAT